MRTHATSSYLTIILHLWKSKVVKMSEEPGGNGIATSAGWTHRSHKVYINDSPEFSNVVPIVPSCKTQKVSDVNSLQLEAVQWFLEDKLL